MTDDASMADRPEAPELPELPPEDSYAPGTLMWGQVLASTPDLHVMAETLQTYPASVIVRLTARFRFLPDLGAQRAVSEEVSRFHCSDEHDGPRLFLGRSEQQLDEARPWGPQGSNRLWRLSFQAPFDGELTDQPLHLQFSWESRGVSAMKWSVDPASLQAVVARGRRVWPIIDSSYRSVV